MNLVRSNIIFVSLMLILIAGCASSNISERYNRPKREDPSTEKKNRFSSDETLASEKKEQKPDTLFHHQEFDDEPYEEVMVNIDEFVLANKVPENNSIEITNREKMLMEIIRFIDTPYKYGGNTPNGMDCSAFTKTVYTNSVQTDLPRSAREQYQIGNTVEREDLQFGDLVFFNTTRRSFPGHVGIYIGENLFAHASRKQGVIISSMETEYYFKRYVGAKRLDLNLK